ncbi:hypothetical protein TOPH_05339 [Tolypocladium ophioglossoides CBS 100239]|uniref:Aminoglycoside phosphotransferase domain-containing protein n=1 Tax=Tolypocladium ophioglossoides (strain CBS 100239) TaxID=1163406 RepID=A0A0L0N7N1_TOLOC|nr:hypothetical protein TOPH_05339 [Tolypocladium ophioglossoides CBS 100239]
MRASGLRATNVGRISRQSHLPKSLTMVTLQKARVLPSSGWSSFDGWNYNGMKERLQAALEQIDKSVLLDHAERIKHQKLTMSKPFSAGQYWICFEMVAEDTSLVIARVRLPRHPETSPAVNEEMRRSLLAAEAGAAYMLLEGFYGNTLRDVEFDICNLSSAVQQHIITQWTKAQAELATLVYPRIGSISSLSATGEPIIDRLASAAVEGLGDAGPFSTTAEYFNAVGQAAIDRFDADADGSSMSFLRIGALVFCDIISNTTLFKDIGTEALFPLNHMDLGTQNILVDDDFNFLAIIDWEFAQTAPWQVNHYPMPFPLLFSDAAIRDILRDPSHLAYKNVVRQEFARGLYRQTFQSAGNDLKKKGRPLTASFAEVLDSPASRIYACFTCLGRSPQADEGLVYEMVRLAFGWDSRDIEEYLRDIERAA